MKTENFLIQYAEFLSHVMGDDTEIVLHDCDGKILWIQNGHLTGRKVGMVEQKISMELLYERAKARGSNFISGYKSISKQGKPLKSSSFFITDDNGKLTYILCVNQDLGAFLELRDVLNRFIGQMPVAQVPDPGNDSLDDVVMKMILQEMERSKPFDMESKEEKVQLISRLEAKGIFNARGTVSTVCDMLHIAQPTLYKYLKELRDE